MQPGTIDFPERISHCDRLIRACRLVHELYPEAFIRTEVKARSKNSEGRVGCVFDAVVFNENKEPRLIIEIKNGNHFSQTSKQVRKYRSFGIPLLIICRNSPQEIILRVIHHALKRGENH